jgi:hypothetical protein
VSGLTDEEFRARLFSNGEAFGIGPHFRDGLEEGGVDVCEHGGGAVVAGVEIHGVRLEFE